MTTIRDVDDDRCGKIIIRERVMRRRYNIITYLT